VIRYGAPGTGKTFTAKRDTSLLFEIWKKKYGFATLSPTPADCSEIVQFHPSYGYEDFMEGLRPVLGDNDKPQLTLQNGHFKEFCRRAGRWEVDVHAIPNAGPDLAGKWETLTLGELRPYFSDHLRDESWREIQQRADSERIAEIVPPFFFIIDEINRAELSRVLGELMLCLEYRGAGNSISTQYAALNNERTGMLKTSTGYRFFIPHNVYVIGTMNTIDRSVESFDLALRRRFRWEQVTPDIAALRYHLKGKDKESGRASRDWAKLADNLEQLNERIRREELLGADYEIGHAYLMNLRYAPTLTRTEVRENLWDDSIRPLLEEYLRGSGRSATLIPEFAKSFGL
jgi:5-methylcytosine-specific restriction protein B